MDWHPIDARVAILLFYDRETNSSSLIAKQSADFIFSVFLDSSYHA